MYRNKPYSTTNAPNPTPQGIKAVKTLKIGFNYTLHTLYTYPYIHTPIYVPYIHTIHSYMPEITAT